MKNSSHPLLLCVRLYRPDGNPLRRRSDRLESALVLAVLLLVLASLWPAVLAGRATYQSVLRDQQGHSRVRIMATLSQDAPGAIAPFTEIPTAEPRAMARWTFHGTPRSHLVPVSPSAKAGSVVPVWVDAAGTLATPPADKAELVGRGLATGALIVLATALPAMSLFLGARRRMNRARYRQWETDWARADHSSA
ncbi:Rv1733c family protein [Nonomuraea sp. CA-143628]|uniref:Rv1733c family protein n=1 Tax=Nonomuraea sp. CA-143628 TaxID=3239997 RepID=UPI003D8DEC69